MSHLMTLEQEQSRDEDHSLTSIPAKMLDSIVDLRHRSALSDSERLAVEQLAFDHGTSADSYFATEPDGHVLLSACQTVAASVMKNLRYWHVPGGILTAKEHRPGAVSWIKELAKAHKVTIAVYNVSPEDVPLFEQEKFEINKFGEEPVLDLGNITWKGKDFEWVRRQRNYCERQGVVCREVLPDAEHPEQWEAIQKELWGILRADLKGRPYPRPLRVLEGQFEPHNLHRRRLFVAESIEAGRIEAFTVCNPMQGGKGWAFENYRRRPDAVRGVIPYLMQSTINRVQEEGANRISFCLVPGKNVAEQEVGKSNWLVRRALNMWYYNLNALFNAQGQDYFKQRFRPRFVERYICVTPSSSLRSVTSFVYITGGFTPSPLNTLKSVYHQIRKKQADPV